MKRHTDTIKPKSNTILRCRIVLNIISWTLTCHRGWRGWWGWLWDSHGAYTGGLSSWIRSRHPRGHLLSRHSDKRWLTGRDLRLAVRSLDIPVWIHRVPTNGVPTQNLYKSLIFIKSEHIYITNSEIHYIKIFNIQMNYLRELLPHSLHTGSILSHGLHSWSGGLTDHSLGGLALHHSHCLLLSLSLLFLFLL
jgi:hypothetical protein